MEEGEYKVIDLWDIDNNPTLTSQQKYNLALELYNSGELNSILPSLPEFEYYKQDINYVWNKAISELRRQVPVGIVIKNNYKLYLIYIIAIFNRNNYNFLGELRNELYDYLDSLDYNMLVQLLTISPNKIPILKYFAQGYFSGNITLDQIKAIEHPVVKTILSWIMDRLLIENKDITDIAKLLLSMERGRAKYESSLLVYFAYHATHEQLDKYHNEKLINLRDKNVIGTMLAINSRDDKNKKDYERFEYILNYYLSKGLTYQYLLESVTISNMSYLTENKLYVVTYLLNTGKVDFGKVYNRANNFTKGKLNRIILNQV